MKIKVCGMKCPDNIESLAKLPIDLMGFIFYPDSPRYAGQLDPEIIHTIPGSIQKTGVFVNAAEEVILDKIKTYKLQSIQLHGTESPEMCLRIKAQGCIVIKAFALNAPDDLKKALPYEGACDYFLFDAKTSLYGGSGQQYDWDILNHYTGSTPFFLSGGIGPEDSVKLLEFKHPKFYGIDLNSRFETEPGRKNIESLKSFLLKIQQS